MMKYICCNERRRRLVLASALNGIDFLEVEDDPAQPFAQRQRRLFVTFLKSLAPGTLDAANLRLDGGETVSQFTFTNVSLSGSTLTVELDHPGDFSPYTLRLVASASTSEPPPGFDPLLSSVDFSFKVNCPTDFDCEDKRPCPPEFMREPDLDYLARDFNSFRQLMLDRLSLLIPAWREQSVADLMHVLVDLKSYLADYQSYQQDAVVTEAYLGTARRRISVRRHARLVDYPMHDGCNARTWVHVTIDGAVGPGAPVALPSGTQLLMRVTNTAVRLERDSPEHRQALGTNPEVFETMHPATLYSRHNRIDFYTWGDDNCCLPRGATRATLLGDLPHLGEGDVLIFEEVRGPETGAKADADLTHRHAVRLLEVRPGIDPVTIPPTRVTEITWHPDDALPFPLCLSGEFKVGDEPAEDEPPHAVSVARGNVVLADHGRSLLQPESLGTVPPPRFRYVEPGVFCKKSEPRTVPVRFRPRLLEGPLTQAAPFNPLLISLDFDPDFETALNGGTVPRRVLNGISASRVLFGDPAVESRADFWVIRNRGTAYVVRHEDDKLNVYDYPAATTTLRTSARDALPSITLRGEDRESTFVWNTRRDLLNSGETAREFVAEVEAGDATWLRFGDDEFGSRPNEGTRFTASYRVGNGLDGNIGAESLHHVVAQDAAIQSVRNPLPAHGGTNPQDIEEVRLKAPHAYRVQERAVTPEDYAVAAGKHPEVQRAAVTYRWTGSWYTVFLTVDRLGGREVDEDFERSLRAHLERYRLAGYDLEVDSPHYVALEIEMEVCVRPEYFRGEVRRDLLELFSNRVLPDGRRGVFHPDNFTFGQTVHLSRLYAAAESVAGVESVRVTKFQKQDNPASSGVEAGTLTLDTLEIARLDNDPNHSKRGIFRPEMKGGK
jgi:hypothetical protein